MAADVRVYWDGDQLAVHDVRLAGPVKFGRALSCGPVLQGGGKGGMRA